MGGGWGVQNRFPISGPGNGIMAKAMLITEREKRHIFPESCQCD